MTPEEVRTRYVQLRVALNETAQRLDAIARAVSALPPRRIPAPGRVFVTTGTALEEVRDAQYACTGAAETLALLQPEGAE